ncbi:transcriptional regulator, TetR family [Blastococcus aurantiacus]|uniref:Transcriptional regulator, TetR family n=1 Tax=Blastococcus aurantiacus TaxID=1550231 RepID=A0A1G7J7F4_9ACTN|nr:TetR-like C-terminal domain-containing protein [Blastococcus aurantiacus]SDF20803.1 transcriptional regulator, TetR family [Blastococcus aurantiacus]
MTEPSPTLVRSPVDRRPGRPRDEDIEERVLAATLALVDAGAPVTLGRVVAGSGASRAAIYRRWPSLTALLAAALDQGREVLRVPGDGDLRERLFGLYLDGPARVAESYTDARFRRRLQLTLADRALQRAYWDAHVNRRRLPVTELLQQGVAAGELRADLDIEATIDLINGVFYYQVIVRGENPLEPATRARCAAALDLVWRGMAAEPR